MKLIEKLNYKTYSAVTLYIDDLRAIYNFLQNKSDKLTLNNKLYQFDNFEDFISNSKENEQLQFEIHDYFDKKIVIELSVNKYSTRLSTVGSDDQIGAHIFVYLDKILSKKAAKKYFLLSPQTTFIYTIVGFYIMFDPFNFLHLQKQKKGVMGFVLILIGTISSRYAMPSSKIVLKHKTEHKNIFQRTKDDIFSNVAASLITAIVGFIAGVLAVKLGIFPAVK